MTVFHAAHVKENARQEQFLWVLIIMKLTLMHVQIVVLVLVFARLKLSNRLKYYNSMKK